jgi:hypothetical protein
MNFLPGKRIVQIFTICSIGLCMSLLTACSPTQVAGGGTRGGNPVVGTLINADQTPAANAFVRLIPSSYDPVSGAPLPKSFTDTTDGHGKYKIIADAGTYNLLASRVLDNSAILLRNINVIGDTVHIPSGSMRTTGSIAIALPDSVDIVNGYVFIEGTDIYKKIDSSKSIILSSVPSGVVPSVQYISRTNKPVSVVFADSLQVFAGDTSLVQSGTWTYSRNINLNTTTSGANVTGAVYGFPVLVRLTSSNFNFSHAKANGDDVRFSKANNSRLAFEIERWDASAQVAEIWVKVDTVYGNDSSQFLTMYWGNPKAANVSNGASVFDTAYGNVGVWHLETGLVDATPNADNGIDSSTADAAGIIGRCRHFDPALHSFITIPNESRFDMTTTVTLSAWVLVDTFSLEWQTIVAKGDDTYRLHRNGLLNDACFSLTTLDTANFGYYSLGGTTPVNDRSWHLVTGVFDGATMKLYVDGNLENDSSATFPCGTNNLNLTIGDNRTRTLISNTPRYFNGSIDEVRVMKTAVSADWIKLCYMNQKTGNTLVWFKD